MGTALLGLHGDYFRPHCGVFSGVDGRLGEVMNSWRGEGLGLGVSGAVKLEWVVSIGEDDLDSSLDRSCACDFRVVAIHREAAGLWEDDRDYNSGSTSRWNLSDELVKEWSVDGSGLVGLKRFQRSRLFGSDGGLWTD